MAAKPSALYEQHLQMGPQVRMAEFAGYLMPLWFTGIAQEHAAVRRAAGLFDCTHMGVLEVAGKGAEAFLNHAMTNDVRRLAVEQAQYTYLLDDSGEIVDDLIVYRLTEDRFWVVANASNEARVQDWLHKILAVWKYDSAFPIALRDLRSNSAGKDRRVDIALQGPCSKPILERLLPPPENLKLEAIKPFHLIVTQITGMEVVVSRTGYTGSKGGYEILVHPDQVRSLWRTFLEKGREFGLVPCGLGARDSLRIEAGLPLYGHELDGEYHISPFEAGYGWAVKLDKMDFLGRSAMQIRGESFAMLVQRLELPGEKGIRPVRPKDAVLTADGRCVGWVLSCAAVSDRQIALIYVRRNSVAVGQSAGVYYTARNARHIQEGRNQHVELDQTVPADLQGVITERFVKFD